MGVDQDVFVDEGDGLARYLRICHRAGHEVAARAVPKDFERDMEEFIRDGDVDALSHACGAPLRKIAATENGKGRQDKSGREDQADIREQRTGRLPIKPLGRKGKGNIIEQRLDQPAADVARRGKHEAEQDHRNE